jgi:hypothetical protein
MNVLSFLSAIPKIIGFAWNGYKWVKKQDGAGVDFLSPAFFANARKDVEMFVMRLAKGQNSGIRKLFESDNAAIIGIGIFLKSDAILNIYKAEGISARLKAEQALQEKDVTKSVERFN